MNLLGLERRALEAFFTDMGEKAFRASQVMKWVYHRGVDDFEAMTDLSRVLRERLAAVAEVALPRVVIDQPSRDGSRKWLLELADGNCVEAVFIPEEGRGTLCVSSQVGCALNCAICSTARQGFNRNLTAGEIVGQVVVAARELGIPENRGERVITNIVLMGMGEPLLNLDHLLPALRLMIDDLGFGVSRRRVTVSTAGVVPAIERLREEGLDVSLAVSLHATDDALRDELVPINRKYPIAELLESCRRYVEGKPHRRVTFEYCMLEGRNDSPEHARQLARLLRRVPSKVNLIPFNAFPGSDYRRPSPAAIDRFREVLLAADITAVTRRPRGEDIDAACGQLVGKVADRTRRRDRLEGAGRLAS